MRIKYGQNLFNKATFRGTLLYRSLETSLSETFLFKTCFLRNMVVDKIYMTLLKTSASLQFRQQGLSTDEVQN